MSDSINARVAIREGREEAREATEANECTRQVLVANVAFAIVGEHRVKELEQEHCSCGKQLYEVSKSREGLVPHAFPTCTLHHFFASSFSKTQFLFFFSLWFVLCDGSCNDI